MMSGPPHGNRHETIVVIPTYCERDNIASIVTAVLTTVPCDILVVDDDSPDMTSNEVEKLSAVDSRIRLLTRKGKKPGLGLSYLDGFQLALEEGYRVIVQMDADFSHPPEVLPKMLEAAESADLVIGSRYVKGGGVTKDWNWKRKCLSRAGSFLARMMLNLKIRDVTGGYKCWRREALSSLCHPILPFSRGFAFQIEMNAKAQRSGFRIVEIPICFSARKKGLSKMSLKIFLEGLTCMWHMRASRRK